MSTFQRITLIGLYNHDSTLFDNLSLPEGYNTETFINTFLLEHGEKCVLYTDPDFMKFSIGVVSKKWEMELARIYEALSAEYNPIENYDRYEEGHDDDNTTFGKTNNVDYSETRKPATTETTTHGTTETTTYGKTDTTTYGKTDTTTYGKTETTTFGKTDTTAQTIDGTTEKKVSAFNSSAYEPSEKTTENNGTSTLTQSGTNSIAGSGTDSVAQAGTDSTTGSGTDSIATTGIDTVGMSGTDTTDIKGKTEGLSGTDYNHKDHDAHIHGNIGVMTAASMVAEIVRQRKDFEMNLYDIAGRIFAKELLIQIY